MPKLTGNVVGFTFQEIPLDEAINVVLAGDGNYSEVKQALLEKLPTLAPDKAFAFGLENGSEVPEDQRRGLCMSINATLKRAKMNWRITYSSVKKMFVCIPKTTKAGIRGPYEKRNSPENINTSEDQKILALRSKGLTVRQIAEQVSTPLPRVQYLCYQVATGRQKEKHRPKPASNGLVKSNGKMSASHLVEVAKTIFNYSGDFRNGDGKTIRKAISVVGINDLKIAPKEIAPLVGLTRGGVSFNASHPSNFAVEEIRKLQKAVN